MSVCLRVCVSALVRQAAQGEEEVACGSANLRGKKERENEWDVFQREGCVIEGCISSRLSTKEGEREGEREREREMYRRGGREGVSERVTQQGIRIDICLAGTRSL